VQAVSSSRRDDLGVLRLPCRDIGRTSRCFAASESFQFFVLVSSFLVGSMGLIGPEPLSVTMRRAAPLHFQELGAIKSFVFNNVVTLGARASEYN
jgi:hypothetical protein